MRLKKVLSNGDVLELDYCKFGDALKLLQHFSLILKKNIKDFSFDEKFINDLQEKGLDYIINNLLTSIFDAVADDELIDLIITCGNQSLLNGERITKSYFEDNIEAGEIFFIVLFEICKYNLVRFMPRTLTELLQKRVQEKKEEKK